MQMWTRTKAFFKELWRRLLLIDWVAAALAILKAAKREDLRVEDKYIVIRPRILSDENYLRGVSVLRGVLTLIPPASIAAPVLGLGAIGFNIWKRIALNAEYDRLEYPPIDPNMLRLSIEMDPELKKHYGSWILEHNWDAETIADLEKVYNDFQFITDGKMLQAKYPHVSDDYIMSRVLLNKHNLQKNLEQIEQGLLKVSQTPEIEHNIREAFETIKELFPAMNDWALFNSEGFEDVVEVLDTIF
jgi:hypothetical protein